MSNVIKPPRRLFAPAKNVSVFLAGSIDLGVAPDWQNKLCNSFASAVRVTFYNPRRDDWDSSWEQNLVSDKFNDQVQWELDFMDAADFVFMYITNESKAPISLLEFGRITALYPQKLVIAVEPKFYRRGNIEVMCNRYKIDLHEDYRGAINELASRVTHRVQQIR